MRGVVGEFKSRVGRKYSHSNAGADKNARELKDTRKEGLNC